MGGLLACCAGGTRSSEESYKVTKDKVVVEDGKARRVEKSSDYNGSLSAGRRGTENQEVTIETRASRTVHASPPSVTETKIPRTITTPVAEIRTPRAFSANLSTTADTGIVRATPASGTDVTMRQSETSVTSGSERRGSRITLVRESNPDESNTKKRDDDDDSPSSISIKSKIEEPEVPKRPRITLVRE